MKRFLLVIALLVSAVGLNAQSTTIDYGGYYSLTFNVTDSENLKCSVTCSTQPTSPTAITIPAEVTIEEKTYSVTSIEDWAFGGCSSLTSIDIPSGVTSIGGSAFNGCSSLQSVTFGENSQLTSIGSYTFNGCSSLTSIDIPSGVTSIGDNTFNGCSSLTSIDIPSGVTSIGKNAFDRCSSLTSIDIPANVNYISGWAFELCSNLKVIRCYATNAPEIGDNYLGNGLNILNIQVPENSVDIYKAAEPWKNYYITKIYPEYYVGEDLGAIDYEGYSLKYTALEDYKVSVTCSTQPSSPTAITIPATVTLRETMFTVTEIEGGAFYQCTNLTSINIPDGVTEIRDGIGNWNSEGAFTGCSNLISVTFGENSQLASIGKNAFNGCSSLTSIEIPSGVTEIGELAFAGCLKLTRITIPSNVTSIGDNAIRGCINLKNITFEENSQLTSIGNYAFAGCSNIKSIVIPDGITKISDGTFEYCSKLESIEIPDGVTEIGDFAFRGCALTDIVIPKKVTEIKEWAFVECFKLHTVTFEEGSELTTIGDYVFGNCGLTSIEIPSRVTRIESGAFSGIKYIVSHAVSAPTASGHIGEPTTVFVPEGSVESYKDYYPWNEYNILPINPAVVTLSVNDAEGGSVMGSGNYCIGMETTLRATPNVGYDFIGWEENGNIVSTDREYTIELNSDRDFVAVFELSKHWIPNVNLYPNNITIIAEVELDNEQLNSTLLEVGAFCGEELRGSGRIRKYNISGIDKYFVFMTVTGETGNTIKFKLYDHGTQEEYIYISFTMLSFEANGNTGTIENPYTIEFTTTARITVTVNPEEAGSVTGAGDYPVGTWVSLKADSNYPYLFESWTINGEVVSRWSTYSFSATESYNIVANFTCSQSTELKAGWNWFSSHTFINGHLGLLAMEDALGGKGLHIKNHNSFVTNYDGTWYGSLWSVSVDEMYIINVSEDHTFVVTGLGVNPSLYPIHLNKNWKWLPYIINCEMPVSEAFSNITPTVDDIIKTQGEFSTYSGSEWIGNLTTMKPGKGYMYYNKSNSGKTLVYPTPSSRGYKTEQQEEIVCHWLTDNTAYPNNMNVIAVLNIDGKEMRDNYEVAAFADGELRGNARPIYVESIDRYMLFMTINGDNNQDLSFTYYNTETEEEVALSNNMIFSVNSVVGSISEPYVFNANINTLENHSENIVMHPNPANINKEINLGATYDKVEVYNTLGAKIAEYDNINKLPGMETSGIYMIKAVAGNETKYNKLIVK